MKIKTYSDFLLENLTLENSLQIVKDINTKLTKIKGVINTPNSDFTKFKIVKLFLFGSVLENKKYPNDIDILMYGHSLQKNNKDFDNYSEDIAIEFLQDFNKNISLHYFYTEALPIAKMCEIYPKFDLSNYVSRNKIDDILLPELEEYF